MVLDLSEYSCSFLLKWIDISSGEWGNEAILEGGSKVTIAAPGNEGWAAAIVKQ